MLKCITAELQINIFAPPTEQENEVKQRFSIQTSLFSSISNQPKSKDFHTNKYVHSAILCYTSILSL